MKIVVGSILSSISLLVLLLGGYGRVWGSRRGVGGEETRVVSDGVIRLPWPSFDGSVSVEKALSTRRSIRDYVSEPLSLGEVSQILWSAYGITETRYGFKTTPSAGATYPLELYLVVNPRSVSYSEGFLEAGSYRYDPYSHSLFLVKRGNFREELYRAALEQEWVRDAAVNIVFTAVFERTTGRYGQRGIRYVWIEVGHAGQNVYLQATAMGLATVAIGAFHDSWVKEIIGAREDEEPLYIMPVARPLYRYEFTLDEYREYIMRQRGQ